MHLSATMGSVLPTLLGATNAHAIQTLFSVSYDGSVTGAGSFSFADMPRIQQVPEPAGLALVGLAVLAVALVRRKRKPQ